MGQMVSLTASVGRLRRQGSEHDPSAVLTRKVLPAVVLLFLAVGGGRWFLERHGLISGLVGVVLMTAVGIGVASGLLVSSARTIRRVSTATRALDRWDQYRAMGRNLTDGGVLAF